MAGTFGCVGAGCVGAGLGVQGLYGVGTHGWGGTYGAGAGAALKQQLGAQLETHEVEQIGGQDAEPKITTANVWICTVYSVVMLKNEWNLSQTK